MRLLLFFIFVAPLLESQTTTIGPKWKFDVGHLIPVASGFYSVQVSWTVDLVHSNAVGAFVTVRGPIDQREHIVDASTSGSFVVDWVAYGQSYRFTLWERLPSGAGNKLADWWTGAGIAPLQCLPDHQTAHLAVPIILQAKWGTPPYQWAVINGTPTTPADDDLFGVIFFTFGTRTVTVTDAENKTATCVIRFL